MNIGTVNLENPFILAPMAGYTDLAFRMLCRQYGAALCYSEMLHCEEVLAAKGPIGEDRLTSRDELPVALQLYGSDPDRMAEAASMLCCQPVSVIDLNMGCPAQKVRALGAGAALMDKPELAKRIIRKVCEVATVPVTVKTRSGSHQHSITAPEFAVMAEDAGASAIVVHARTCSEGFSGPVDFGVLARIKALVSIPVIGNGGIESYEGGLRMMRESGCDGVMIGRAAIGAPWIFSKRVNPLPSSAFRIKALLRHLELIEHYHPSGYPLAKIKNHAWKYFHDRQDIKSLRERIAAMDSVRQLHDLIASWR